MNLSFNPTRYVFFRNRIWMRSYAALKYYIVNLLTLYNLKKRPNVALQMFDS
jgi:hypothetical protein